MGTTEAARRYAEEYWRNIIDDLPPHALIDWNLGTTSESCAKCAELARQGPITAEEFKTRGIYPQSLDLDCHGYNCRCFLTVTAAVSIDSVLDDLGRYGAIGDADLAALYEQVHQDLIDTAMIDAGLTPRSAGKSWFDAPASSQGSFTGLRYGDQTLAQSFDVRPAQVPDESLESKAKWRNGAFTPESAGMSWFDAPATSAGSFKGLRYGSDETISELAWREFMEPPVVEPSWFDAQASSAGVFLGERYEPPVG